LDLHARDIPPTSAEKLAVDAVLGPPQNGWEGGTRSPSDGRIARGGLRARMARRTLLLPALHALQDGTGGISVAGLDYVCRRLSVAPAEAYGVASAYAQFELEVTDDTPHGPEIGTSEVAINGPTVTVHLCDDIACRAARHGDPFETAVAQTSPLVRWKRSPCLGQCDAGSAALVHQPSSGRLCFGISPFTVAEADALARGGLDDLIGPRTARPVRKAGPLLRSSVSPGQKTFPLLRQAIERGPNWVIEEIRAANLSGRGGAAYPTAMKWEAVRANAMKPHYFICNADESEPGTFKDRTLIENNPFGLIESVAIAGFTTGSEHAYIYIRGEYPEAEGLLRATIDDCYRKGIVGPSLLGSGPPFDIEIRRGAGAYIAGEETALFNSIEGFRPEPRNKPPFPVQSGLFRKPTAVNNVETLFAVLEVIRSGGEAFARTGTAEAPGTRLFCVSGNVTRAGIYELEQGFKLSELIAMAGGVPEGRTIQAVLLGGAAGSFVGRDDLDIVLSKEGLRGRDATLGSGVVMVFDDLVDLKSIVARIAAFFRDESCGQCVPCRVGTVRQEELVARVISGKADPVREAQILDDLATVMRDSSICGLGQTAPSAVSSAFRLGLLS
jgi:NADH-quinone oxidoreductase subunit F